MRLENIKVHVEGTGDGIVLLHGWGQSYRNLLPIYEYFKKKHRVLTFDLMGFHENENFECALNIEQYAKILHTLIQKYELNNVSIIAHSFGARIAFVYASMFECKQLILSGAAGLLPRRTMRYYYQIYKYKVKKKLGLNVSQMGSEDYRNASNVLKQTMRLCVNDDLSSAIRKINVPILLIWGSEDDQTPIWMAYKVLKLNEFASLVVFEKDDHFAIYHQMQRFIRVCETILKEG